MGLKSAVIVVAGWETWDEETDEADAEGSAEVEDSVGGWNEGGVASGSVVKRMPVDTVKQKQKTDQRFRGTERTSTDDDDTTSCALLCGAEVDLGAGGDPPFQASFHRVFLVYPLHPAAARRRRRGSGSLRLVSELAKVVEHPDANHAVLRTVSVLRAPATRVVL